MKNYMNPGIEQYIYIDDILNPILPNSTMRICEIQRSSSKNERVHSCEKLRASMPQSINPNHQLSTGSMLDAGKL